MNAGRWRGATVAILASGPSLTAADVELVRAWRDAQPGARRVIVVGTTFRLALWADVLYASDEGWWNVYGEEALREFRGECWAGAPGWRALVHYVEVVKEPGLSPDCARIHGGGNSGYQAIGLAYAWGAARMVLTGYDMQRTGGRSHHFGDHEGALPNLGPLKEWRLRMARMAVDLKAHGVQVLNATRETALTCFRCVPLEQALGLEEVQGDQTAVAAARHARAGG